MFTPLAGNKVLSGSISFERLNKQQEVYGYQNHQRERFSCTEDCLTLYFDLNQTRKNLNLKQS